MPRRTLQASATGREKARKALVRLGLTQKELSEEEPPIAGWSTINRFFNGHGIDHLIFQEICLRLNLDWREICDRPGDQPARPTPPPAGDPQLLAVFRQAEAAGCIPVLRVSD